jgi:hypothetical protein
MEVRAICQAPADIRDVRTVGAVKHVTYSDKSLLVGDEVADLLIEYAAQLGRMNQTDTVTIRAIGADGNEVSASFLLNPSSILMVESASTTATEPENGLAEEYLQSRIDGLRESFEVPSTLASEGVDGGDRTDGGDRLDGGNGSESR